MDAKIAQAIDLERSYQDEKWGVIKSHPHSVGEWLLIAEAELNEAKKAWVEGKGDTFAIAELLQVVAVGVACMEQHGIRMEAKHLQLLKERGYKLDKSIDWDGKIAYYVH